MTCETISVCDLIHFVSYFSLWTILVFDLIHFVSYFSLWTISVYDLLHFVSYFSLWTILVCDLIHFVSYFSLSSLMVSHFDCFSLIQSNYLKKSRKDSIDLFWRALWEYSSMLTPPLFVWKLKFVLKIFTNAWRIYCFLRHKTNNKLKDFFHDKEDDSNTPTRYSGNTSDSKV